MGRKKEDNIIEFAKEKNKNSRLLGRVLSKENIDNVSHRLDVYIDEFLEIEEYSKCNQLLSKISEKIENIEDKDIRKLFEDYQRELIKKNEYELCMSNFLGLTDGILIGLVNK